MDLTKVSVELLNEVVGADRGNLGETAANLVEKLKTERDKLNQSFLLNLPISYNDEKKFGLLCDDIGSFNKKLINLKLQNAQLSSQIENYKNEDKTQTQSHLDQTLKPLVVKSLYIERYLSYLSCLTQMNEYT
jgi:hypothetical protein